MSRPVDDLDRPPEIDCAKPNARTPTTSPELDPQAVIEFMIETIPQDEHKFRNVFPERFIDDLKKCQDSLWSPMPQLDVQPACPADRASPCRATPGQRSFALYAVGTGGMVAVDATGDARCTGHRRTRHLGPASPPSA